MLSLSPFLKRKLRLRDGKGNQLRPRNGFRGVARPGSGCLGLPPSTSPYPRAPTTAPRATSPERTRGAPAARAGSRDAPGPRGAEAVGGRGLPGPAGPRSPIHLALLTPGGGSRDPGEEDEDEEDEGRAAAAAANTPEAHSQLGQSADKRDTSRRALPLSGHVTSGRPGVGPLLAPPRGRLDSVDSLVRGRTLRLKSASALPSLSLLPPVRAPVRLAAGGWTFKNERSVGFPPGKKRRGALFLKFYP